MKYVKGQFVICLCALAVIAVCRCIDDKLFQEKPKEYKAFFTPGTGCENNIIAAINKAQKIEIAVYSITHPSITNAIIAAHNRGATIRIVTDRQMANGKGSRVEEIRSAGIPVLTNMFSTSQTRVIFSSSSPLAFAPRTTALRRLGTSLK